MRAAARVPAAGVRGAAAAAATAAATAAEAPVTAAATAAAEAGSPPAASRGRKCEDGTPPDIRGMKDSSVTAGSIAAAAAAVEPAAATDMARPLTPGSTAAGTIYRGNYRGSGGYDRRYY
jgi:hypothetical protein